MASNTAERVTVNLTAKSSVALANRAEVEGLSKTDVINRALQLYSFLGAERDMGRELVLRDGDRIAEVHFL
jgi:hypothetical protein